MPTVHTATDTLQILARRGLAISQASLARYVRLGVVSEPVRLGGRPVWGDAEVDELARQVPAYRRGLETNGFGAHRKARAA